MNMFAKFVLTAGLACGASWVHAANGFEDEGKEVSAAPEQIAGSEATAKQRLCPDETATRIKRRDETKCIGSGRVYTQEQLRSTGATNAAGALSRLDPSVY
jgi:hypothetical protein